jgi:hypothetical protein
VSADYKSTPHVVFGDCYGSLQTSRAEPTLVNTDQDQQVCGIGPLPRDNIGLSTHSYLCQEWDETYYTGGQMTNHGYLGGHKVTTTSYFAGHPVPAVTAKWTDELVSCNIVGQVPFPTSMGALRVGPTGRERGLVADGKAISASTKFGPRFGG